MATHGGVDPTQVADLAPDLAANLPSTSTTPPETQGEETTKMKRGRTFTDEDRARAALARSEQARRRREAKEQLVSTTGLTSRQRVALALSKVTQEDMDAVINQLVLDAKAGEVKSIHALARLMDQSFGRAREEEAPDGREVAEKQWAEMTPAEKAAIRANLLAEVRAQQAQRQAQGDSSDPRAHSLGHSGGRA